MGHHSFRLNPAIHDEEAFIDPRILAWGEYLSPNVESHPLTDAAADNDQAVAGDAIPAALAGNADPAMGQASFAGAQVPSHFGMSHPAHRALDANHAALYYPHGAIYPQASDQVLGADMGHPANEALQAHQAAYGNPSGPTVHGNPTGPTVHDNPHGAGHLVAGPSTARNGRRRPAPWTEEEDQELLRLAAIQNRRGGRMYTYGRMIVSLILSGRTRNALESRLYYLRTGQFKKKRARKTATKCDPKTDNPGSKRDRDFDPGSGPGSSTGLGATPSLPFIVA